MVFAVLTFWACRGVFHGILSVPEGDDGAAMLFFQQFIESVAAKLVMVPSLLCEKVHDNFGYGELEGVFKVIDTKDEIAILLSCSPYLSFMNLVAHVKVGSKTEVSVNAFQAKATARVDVPEILKGRSKLNDFLLAHAQDSFPVQVFIKPVWGGTNLAWVQTNHGMEDLMGWWLAGMMG